MKKYVKNYFIEQKFSKEEIENKINNKTLLNEELKNDNNKYSLFNCKINNLYLLKLNKCVKGEIFCLIETNNGIVIKLFIL